MIFEWLADAPAYLFGTFITLVVLLILVAMVVEAVMWAAARALRNRRTEAEIRALRDRIEEVGASIAVVIIPVALVVAFVRYPSVDVAVFGLRLINFYILGLVVFCVVASVLWYPFKGLRRLFRRLLGVRRVRFRDEGSTKQL